MKNNLQINGLKRVFNRFSLAFGLVALLGSFAYGQQVISGKVSDVESGGGLPGVSILVKGTATGTTSDTDGNYKLTVPNERSVLVFSYIGYLSQESTVQSRSKIDIKLIVDTKSLSEVVVVGYGNQERRDVTGSVVSIKTQNIKDMPVTSVDQKLAGQVAGVQVSQVSGAQVLGQSFGFAARVRWARATTRST